MNPYTKEQREAWDKITGPGLYNVEGEQAYQYLCHLIKWLVIDKTDPHTVLVIGEDKPKAEFFKHMSEEGVIDGVVWEPEFFCYPDYRSDPNDEASIVPRSLWSEEDTETFCNFIRNARVKSYHNVAAVVLLEENDQLKHVDRLLKIPVWRGSTKEKDIELPVYSVHHRELPPVFSKVNNNPTPSRVKSTIEITWGHEMKPESVAWLVPEFIPLHQATAFSGEMDTRKSTLALSIAASGSLMGSWFTGAENNRKPFITLVAADEDTYTTTVLPRFIAAGGYRQHLGCLKLNVTCQKQTNDGLQEWSTPLSFDGHLNLLGESIQEINNGSDFTVGLLINDPIISFFGNKNYNNPQDARDIMRGLKKLSEELKVTIVNICHFNKTQGLTAKQKTAGSKALIEAHRMAWAFDLMEDDKTTTLIAPIKHNLMKAAKSYRITTDDTQIKWPIGNRQHQTDSVGKVRFVGYSNMTADERIEEKESKDRGNRKAIKQAILDVLKDGPKPAGHVCSELRDMGGIATLRRAAQSLEDEGKLRRCGNNNRNMVWQLATEAEPMPVFQGVATNG